MEIDPRGVHVKPTIHDGYAAPDDRTYGSDMAKATFEWRDLTPPPSPPPRSNDPLAWPNKHKNAGEHDDDDVRAIQWPEGHFWNVENPVYERTPGERAPRVHRVPLDPVEPIRTDVSYVEFCRQRAAVSDSRMPELFKRSMRPYAAQPRGQAVVGSAQPVAYGGTHMDVGRYGTDVGSLDRSLEQRWEIDDNRTHYHWTYREGRMEGGGNVRHD